MELASEATRDDSRDEGLDDSSRRGRPLLCRLLRCGWRRFHRAGPSFTAEYNISSIIDTFLFVAVVCISNAVMYVLAFPELSL